MDPENAARIEAELATTARYHADKNVEYDYTGTLPIHNLGRPLGACDVHEERWAARALAMLPRRAFLGEADTWKRLVRCMTCGAKHRLASTTARVRRCPLCP